MNSKKISDSQKIISVILTVLTIILFFFGIMFMCEFISDYKYDRALPYRRSTLEYQVDFPVRLAEETRADRMRKPDAAGMKEYYALGEYIDAQMQIGINTALGKEDLVSYWTDKSDEARLSCGSLESFADKISKSFDR